MSRKFTPHFADAKGALIDEPGIGVMFARGTTVPTDATAGYATGCLFLKTNGTSITALYQNTGSSTSCTFKPVLAFAQGAILTTQLTSITHTAPGTPDYAVQDLTTTTPFGFVSKDEGNTVLSVILNLQVRLAEVEARLEAAGIVASN